MSAAPDSAGLVAGSGNLKPAVKRPISITILGWLFIVGGILAIWDVIMSLGRSNVSLNFGVFFVPLGIGMLRLRRAAHTWASVVVLIFWLGLVLMLIFGLFGGSDVRFHEKPLVGWERIAAVLATSLIFGALLAWVTRVLWKYDELFTDRR